MFIELPDFGTPLNRIAGSVEKAAGLRPGEGAELTAEPAARAAHDDAAATRAEARPVDVHDGGVVPLPAKPEIAPAKPKERIHA